MLCRYIDEEDVENWRQVGKLPAKHAVQDAEFLAIIGIGRRRCDVTFGLTSVLLAFLKSIFLKTINMFLEFISIF